MKFESPSINQVTTGLLRIQRRYDVLLKNGTQLPFIVEWK
jgi:hypothetical protein